MLELFFSVDAARAPSNPLLTLGQNPEVRLPRGSSFRATGVSGDGMSPGRAPYLKPPQLRNRVTPPIVGGLPIWLTPSPRQIRFALPEIEYLRNGRALSATAAVLW